MTLFPTELVKCWHIADWPEDDQRLWHHQITPADPFAEADEPGSHYGSTLRADSRLKVRKGYGRWLSFLASRSWLDATVPALDRVTVPRLRAYCRSLLREGNQSSTVIGRFCDLTMAMRIIAPGKDVSWIQKPDGVTIYALLPKSQKPVRVPSCETLFDWGLTMMKGAALLPDVTARLLAYRDGLLITLLASRGRRRRSLSLLTIGREIFKEGDHYRIELAPHQVKTNKPDRFDIGGSLTASLDHYLGIVRPALLGDSGHESFWVGQSGRPLTLKGLTQRLHVLSRQRFGYSFGTHAFRHALSTMLAEHDPHTPGLAAAVLGISPTVNMAHYNRAKQRGPLIKFALLIDQRKAALAGR